MSTEGPAIKKCLKTKSTYYTNAMVENARKNVEKYDWAKKIKESAVRKADRYLQYGLDTLWSLVTSQSVPRSINVCSSGCPVCGDEIFRKYGHYSWQTDAFTRPWKIVCPNCHHVFPSNDFESYYKSGIDKNGFFHPEKADKRFLKNELYKDKPSDWGVDDGYGWTDEHGKHWKFIAYYNHIGLWSLSEKYEGSILDALKAFETAYLLSGNLAYAKAGLVLLDRIADVYPDMDLAVYKDSDGYSNSHGGTGQGKIAGSISETMVVKPFLTAYDAFYPALSKADIVPFLSEKARKYSMINTKNSVEDIQWNIEEGIVKQIFPSIQKAQIRGNTGMHQSALALAALVIDNEELSREWMEWIFAPGYIERKENDRYRITGGNMAVALMDQVDRDGFGDESSPNYNYLWVKEFITLANVTRHFHDKPEWNMFNMPKLKKMIHAFVPLIFSGKFTPLIGDTGAAGKPEVYIKKEDMILGYKVYRTEILAQTAYFLNGNSIEGIHDDIFSENPDKIAWEIQDVIQREGTLSSKSFMMPSYGLAGLRDGQSNEERAVWLYFGRNIGHGHKDTLNLGLYAFGIDMATDLGNPEYKRFDWAKRFEWTLNTVSHNTVTVDGAMQGNSLRGNPYHFESADRVKLVDVNADKVYSKTSMYRRTVALIKIDDESSYVMDVFRVKGGNDHVYSFHGPEGAVDVRGLNLKKQAKGTYAGEDVPFGYAYDRKDPTISSYQGSGFHYLYDVERDENPPDTFEIIWNAKDTWNLLPPGKSPKLSLTVLTKLHEAALASGDPARNQPGAAENYRYFLARRRGENLESRFLSVMEPYVGNKKVLSIEKLKAVPMEGPGQEEDVAAIKVTLESGRTDYIINAIHSDTVYAIDDRFVFCGHFGLYQEQNGKPVYAFLCDGTKFNRTDCNMIDNVLSAITGTVADFTKEYTDKNQILIHTEEPVKGSLKGRFAYVKTGEKDQTAFFVEDSRNIGSHEIVLDIGDVTLIEGWKNASDLSKGYRYAIEEKGFVRIPLSYHIEF
jgi:hypothetical protein